MNTTKFASVIFLWTIATGFTTAFSAIADDEFNPRVVVNRKFPTIKDVKSHTREEAEKVLKDDELVLGVEINGEARAYAINMLTGPTREIINDDLGGQSIAATW